MNRFKNSIKLVFIGLLLFICFSFQAIENKERPNILLIISDDLRTELNCYGSEYITPSIDKLAERGAMCTRAYCLQPDYSAGPRGK